MWLTTADLRLCRRLFRQARPYRAHLAGLFLLELVATPLALLDPVPLKIAVDSAVGGRPLPGVLAAVLPAGAADSPGLVVAVAIALLLAVAVLAEIHSLAVSFVRWHVGERLVLDFQSELFRHCQRVSFAYHDEHGAFDATNRIDYDAPAIRYLILDGLIPFLTSVVMVVVMLDVTLRLDAELALVALSISPVFVIAARFYRRRLREQWSDLREIESGASAVVQEALSTLRIVKAFGQEQHEEARFVRESWGGIRARLGLLLTDSGFSAVISIATAIGTACVLGIGIAHVRAGTLTLGNLLIVLGYLATLYEPLQVIGRKAASVQSHLASADRALALLDQPPDVVERPDARAIRRATGNVVFDGVSFEYEKGQAVLQDVSFAVSSGSSVGIVGMSGTGKTTLAGLLMRFFDPTAGRILLDGLDLRDYRVADLRNQFALVPQDVALFSGTIAENIAYARRDALEADIVRAARAANAHEFITRLPEGYQTVVGERGMRLSGGERQRISIARAFLRDAPILLLDEPTSSVDVWTEAEILEGLDRLTRDRTTFFITHRLSSLKRCDVLLIVADGRPVTVTSDVAAALDALSAGAPCAAQGETFT